MANQPQNQLLTITQGVTAQTWAGPAMTAGSTVLGNLYDAQAAGSPNPEDARAGYLAVGQPGGNPADVLVPNVDGSGASGSNLLKVGSPAGTAGGGGYYPGPINPMLASGWTIQSGSNEDSQSNNTLSISGTLTGSVVHTGTVTITPTISGGTSPYNVVTTEVDDLATSTLPTGFTLTAATGVLVYNGATTPSPAGTYTFSFRVQDSSATTLSRYYNVTIVLS